tara:strand:- start:861 stop:1073 length:213 start_codon:yes stop_codon:yes gene_type:complete
MNKERKDYNKKKLTIYFNSLQSIKKIEKIYDKYVDKYDGLATTKNRFITALLMAGIEHYAKDNSIAWEVN